MARPPWFGNGALAGCPAKVPKSGKLKQLRPSNPFVHCPSGRSGPARLHRGAAQRPYQPARHRLVLFQDRIVPKRQAEVLFLADTTLIQLSGTCMLHPPRAPFPWAPPLGPLSHNMHAAADRTCMAHRTEVRRSFQVVYGTYLHSTAYGWVAGSRSMCRNPEARLRGR
jgi:hypothetical protein